MLAVCTHLCIEKEPPFRKEATVDHFPQPVPVAAFCVDGDGDIDGGVGGSASGGL